MLPCLVMQKVLWVIWYEDLHGSLVDLLLSTKEDILILIFII